MEYYYSVKKNSIVEFAGQKIGSSHEVSYRKKGPAENRATGHLYYLQAKSMTALCSYSESLNEAEFKSNGLTFLAEESASQSPIRALSQLLFIARTQTYSNTAQKNRTKIHGKCLVFHQVAETR